MAKRVNKTGKVTAAWTSLDLIRRWVRPPSGAMCIQTKDESETFGSASIGERSNNAPEPKEFPDNTPSEEVDKAGP